MKKILISLSIIGAIAAVVISGSMALFSDTETSLGNIITAGSLDLKVDHKYSMYNGRECVRECVEQLGTNLIKNGSFEVPEVTDSAKWQIFPSGTADLEWTVEWTGSETSFGGRARPEPALAEYHEGVLGNAQDGDQYAELDSDWYGPHDPLNNEPALIKIYQNIPTVPGAKYRLHYYYAPRPNTNNGENILDVEIDDANIAHHDSAGGGGSIVWAEYTYEFFAANASTKIEFIGGGVDNSLGIFLDNVTVHPYICEYEIVGGTCNLWELKNLDESDQFWNFDDIKPGDYGINIISLHAFDNDAYACLKTSDVVDQEITVNDPEITAGDNIASVVGELSQFIKFFVWEDVDQNNTYNLGDVVISGPNASFDDALGKISLVESNTKYIGLAWCAGTQSLDGYNIKCDGSTMGNIAQTDKITASFTVYAEQQRNNSDFSCTTLVSPTPFVPPASSSF